MITFRGHSDDIVMVEGNGKDDDEYYRNGGGDNENHFASFVVGGEMRVHAFYGLGPATWCFAIDLIDEDVPLPEWPIRFRMEGYSAVLEIDAPPEVRVFQEKV